VVTASGSPRRLDPWVLWFAGGAFFACYLGQTVLGVIQPTIAAELELSASEAQWVVNSFFLTLALFAAPGGRLGDYYGHRRVLLVALVVFAVGSLSAAVSQGFGWLVASIAVAGMGASTLYPSSAAMVANRVPLEIRGRAIGRYSAIGVSVFVIGPVAAGLLTEVISWRALFGLLVVVGVGLALLGWRKVENMPVGEPERFDTTGLIVLMVGLTALLVSLMQALAWGWDSAATIALFGAGAAVLAGFGALELRRAHPLLDVSLLGRRMIAGIVIAMFCAQFVLNGFVIYIATYFQHVFDYGALEASVAMVPSMLLQPYVCLKVGEVTDRLGPRRPAIGGYLLAAAALGWTALFVGDDSYWLLVPGFIAFSISVAPMFTALLTGLSNAVAASERGDANALVLTIRWIGAAAGTMVLGVIVLSGAGGDGVAGASRYEAAFAVCAAVALLGALACFLFIRDPAPHERQLHHHFRPHF
jgi:MFS family permease